MPFVPKCIQPGKLGPFGGLKITEVPLESFWARQKGPDFPGWGLLRTNPKFIDPFRGSWGLPVLCVFALFGPLCSCWGRRIFLSSLCALENKGMTNKSNFSDVGIVFFLIALSCHYIENTLNNYEHKSFANIRLSIEYQSSFTSYNKPNEIIVVQDKTKPGSLTACFFRSAHMQTHQRGVWGLHVFEKIVIFPFRSK